jgi:hypothetical protein
MNQLKIERDDESIEIVDLEKDSRYQPACIKNSKDSEASCQPTEQNASSPNQQEVEWTPPNGGYGWVCVITAFFINMHTWGLNSVSCRFESVLGMLGWRGP